VLPGHEARWVAKGGCSALTATPHTDKAPTF
jgi:hypothetical protein